MGSWRKPVETKLLPEPEGLVRTKSGNPTPRARPHPQWDYRSASAIPLGNSKSVFLKDARNTKGKDRVEEGHPGDTGTAGGRVASRPFTAQGPAGWASPGQSCASSPTSSTVRNPYSNRPRFLPASSPAPPRLPNKLSEKTTTAERERKMRDVY